MSILLEILRGLFVIGTAQALDSLAEHAEKSNKEMEQKWRDEEKVAKS